MVRCDDFNFRQFAPQNSRDGTISICKRNALIISNDNAGIAISSLAKYRVSHLNTVKVFPDFTTTRVRIDIVTSSYSVPFDEAHTRPRPFSSKAARDA